MVLLVPILAPATFTIVPSSFMPLTMRRVAFGVTLGIIARRYRSGFPLRFILKDQFVKILIIFTGLLALTSMRDSFIYHTVISHLPNIFYSLVLCFLIIKDEKDCDRLVTVFVWQGALIGILIFLEYFTDFNAGDIIQSTSPRAASEGLQRNDIFALYRNSFFRVNGIEHSAVNTSYRLVFLFPLSLWYFFHRNTFLKVVPFVMILAGLIFLQTRAAFVAILTSSISLVLGLFLIKGRNLFDNAVSISKNCVVVILVAAAVFAFPTTRNIAKAFIQEIQSPIASRDMSLESKINRIPLAFEFFKDRPLTGYGSPQHAYFELMRCADLPAPMIYLLSGGILMLFFYLLTLFYMPYSVFSFSKNRFIGDNQREFLIYASSAFVGGITVVFSNCVETHFWIMYMLYISIYKVYGLKLAQKRDLVLTSPRPSGGLLGRP